MFETGLAVGRSLGRKEIKVVGIDFKKDIGFYSKYIHGQLCPHPIEEESKFMNFLISHAYSQEYKPVLFVTSDDFLAALARNRTAIEEAFLTNLPANNIISSVTDKYLQYELAKRAGIPCPVTYSLKNGREIDQLKARLPYPVFVKAQDVNEWRRYISSSTKGYVVHDEKELTLKFKPIIENGLRVIVQEIVSGPDTNHYKICCCISREGEFLLVFTLQKLRQQPVRFGVGSAVMSVYYPELVEIGIKFLTSIGYRGVGSAEFKIDEKDGKLKLIELNPRYWQQNSLSERCGMNFPYVDYLEATDQKPKQMLRFRKRLKWVNIFMDFQSFLSYWSLKQLTLGSWISSLKGVKTFSDFAVDDIAPALYVTRSLKKIHHIRRYCHKTMFGHWNAR
jgi:D-aspartate ligase